MTFCDTAPLVVWCCILVWLCGWAKVYRGGSLTWTHWRSSTPPSQSGRCPLQMLLHNRRTRYIASHPTWSRTPEHAGWLSCLSRPQICSDKRYNKYLLSIYLSSVTTRSSIGWRLFVRKVCGSNDGNTLKISEIKCSWKEISRNVYTKTKDDSIT